MRRWAHERDLWLRGRTAPAPYSQVLCRQPRHLRGSACISRSTRSRRDVQQAPRRPPDAPEQFICAAWLSNTTHPCRTIIDSDPESATTPIHRYPAEQGLGHRHNLYMDLAGLALPGGGDGLVLTKNHRLGHQRDDTSRGGPRRRIDGGPEPKAASHHHSL